MTRSQSIIVALVREIERRQSTIDAAPDVVEISISLKLVAGTEQVRAVSYREEHVPGASRRAAPDRRL